MLAIVAVRPLFVTVDGVCSASVFSVVFGWCFCRSFFDIKRCRGASFSVTVNDFSVSASVLTVDLSPNVFLYLFVLSETFDMTEACGN